MRADAMPASVISKAIAGGASCKSDSSLSMIIGPALRLDKRNFVDFPQGGDPPAHLLHRRIAQEGHAVFLGGACDFRGGAGVQDHFAEPVPQTLQFVVLRAAADPRAAEHEAAGPFH